MDCEPSDPDPPDPDSADPDWCHLPGDEDPGGGEPEHPSPLAEVVGRLNSALDDAQAVPLSCQSPESVVGFAQSLVRVRSRVDAVLGSAVVAVGSSAEAAGDSGIARPRRAADAVAAHCGADPKPLAARSRLTQWLDGFTGFGAAHGAGVLTTDHVRVLRQLDNTRTRAALTEAQDTLIEAARTLTWAEFVRVTRYWALAADPDGPEPDDQVASRSCRIGKRADGTVTGRFQLDPVTGDAVVNAIATAEQALFRADAEAGSDRTASQRKADALAALITGGHTARAKRSGHPAPPLVHLVLSQLVAEQLVKGDTPDIDPHDVDRRCELADGTPLHPRHAAQILAAATLRRLVLGAKSEAVDLGRAVRTFPSHLKAALLAAARGRCRVPGCTAPVPWLQADHVQPWHRDGPTALSNGQILCDPHNKAKGDAPPPVAPPDPYDG